VADRTIDQIVEAVSDGEVVDWAAVRRELTAQEDLKYCAHLETLAKIGQLADHRDRFQREPRGPRWISILMGVALLQIALGFVGSLVYRPYSFVNVLRLLTVMSFTGVGVVLWAARANMRARDLGAVFVLRALGFSRNPYISLFDAWVPGASSFAPLRTGLAVDAWSPFFIWQFARRFPVTTRFTRIDRVAMAFSRFTGIVGALLFAINLLAVIGPFDTGLIWSFSLTHEEGQRFSATLLMLTVPALIVILLRGRAAPAHEQARVRVFAWALAAGTLPACLEVILEALVPAYTALLRESSVALTVMVALILPPLLIVPFVTAYAVLVHRLMDVRIVIRVGIRYLLAKWTIVAFTFAPFALLISHVYERRNDSVAEVLAGPTGATLLALAILCGVLLAVRPALVRTLDRWFDRRGVDRSAVLAQSGTALRVVRTRSEFVTCVADAADRALSATAAVLFFDERRQAYVSAQGAPALSRDSALATILMQEPTISVLNARGENSIARFLPLVEQRWLDETAASVVVPIRTTGIERPAALIALGTRRDAIGYSLEDERFVTALASAAGIALENLRLRSEAVGEQDDEEFGVVCARCRRVIDSERGQAACPCGGALEPTSVPRRINNKFLVEGVLGRGGMGVAYLASDIALNRHVAIKTLPSASAEAMARLAREARTMAALSHPNLATILGHESWRGTPMLVCEYLPGGTLQQRLARGPLPVADAVAIGVTLLSALEYMHGQRVLHRDIKPSNIAFTRDKTPKLLDFGLAGLLEQIDPFALQGAAIGITVADTRPAGTVAYLPPQAFAGASPTIQFDLWALSVVMFEAIVGRHPFADGAETRDNICRGRFVVNAGHAGHVSPAVAGFLHRALRSSTDPPFMSAAAMRDALSATAVA
jgi:GAF domain-containing protein